MILKRKKPFFRKINLRMLATIFLLGTFFGAIVVGVRSNFFTIQNIDCKTQYGECSQSENEKLASYLGKSMVFVDTHDLQKDLEEEYANLRVSIQRIFPHTLKIILEKRKAVVALRPQTATNGVFLVDHHGVLIDYVLESNLPVLHYRKSASGMRVGGRLSKQETSAVQILFLIYKSQGVLEAVLEEQKLLSVLSVGSQVLFSLERDPKSQVGALQLVMTRSRIEDELPMVIDLRYIKPVLKYGSN